MDIFMLHADALLTGIRAFARRLAADRPERQRRRALDPADIDALRQIGLHLASIPVAYGGWYQSREQSIRVQCDALRLLAQGDPSLALVSSMHPSVLTFWREPDPPETGQEQWEAQRRAIFEGVSREGHWWGTITSEPGSGGDIDLSRATAVPVGPGEWDYRISGEKHFGSGSGATTHMLTSARREGAEAPDWYFLDVRGVPWDGSTGIKMKAPWDGHGMAATNSHAFTFTDMPATRMAWPGTWRAVFESGGLGGLINTAPIVGVVEAAMRFVREDFARRGKRAADFRAFEKVEWATAHREAALIYQTFEAAVSAVERGQRGRHESAIAKANIAVLAESVLGRLCRVTGGGAYARYSPLGFWFEDVRAAGFLRPPWAVALDGLFAMSFQGEPGALSIEEPGGGS